MAEPEMQNNEEEDMEPREIPEDEIHKTLRLFGIEMDEQQQQQQQQQGGADVEITPEERKDQDYATREDILRGTIHKLPPYENTTVSVYIISTATDFTVEKNLLHRETIPALRKLCYEKGFELRILDPRWSVREEVETDHMALDICMEQLTAARQTSAGPFCVVLLGERYGTMPWPSQVEETEFSILYDYGKRERFDVLLLDDWFQKDENTSPGHFILQPVTSRFPFFNDESEANKQRRKKDMEDWAVINNNIATLFRTTATKAYEKDSISHQQKLKYFRSVIEKEIAETFVNPNETEHRVCVLQRTFRETPSRNDKMAKRYFDASSTQEADQEATERLDHIRDVILPLLVPSENVKSFCISWDSHGITTMVEEHDSYLNRFSAEFRKQLDKLVVHHKKSHSHKEENDPLHKEVIQHSRSVAEHAAEYIVKHDFIEEVYRRLVKVYIDESIPDETEAAALNAAASEKEDMKEAQEEKKEGSTGSKEDETKDKDEQKEDHKKDDNEKGTENETNEKPEIEITDENQNDQQNEIIGLSSDGQEITEVQNANTEEIINTDHVVNEGHEESVQVLNNNTINNDLTANEENSDENTHQASNNESDNSEKDDNKNIVKPTNIAKTSAVKIEVESQKQIDEQDESNPKKSTKEKRKKTGKGKKRGKKKRKAVKKVGYNEHGDDLDQAECPEDEYKVLTEDDMMIHHTLDIPEVSEQEEFNQYQALLREIHPKIIRLHHKPLIITGAPGTGKSTLMARMIQDFEKWNQVPTVKIFRHIGATNASQSIRQVISTICQQIWTVYGIESDRSLDIEDDFTLLCKYFNNLLHKLPTAETPLLLAIDGVENLDETDDPQSMSWLPMKLPKGIHMMVSVSSKLEKSCISALQDRLKDNERYLELVDELPDSQINDLLENWMEKQDVNLHAMQLQSLTSRIKTNKSMLYAKIALLQATTWRSYMTRADMVVSNTIKETFEKILLDIEKSFGRTVTFRMLGFLTCSRHGLTEQEFEDLLSCDDELLLDAYLYYNPADEQVVRVPQLLWMRLRHEIAVYLRLRDVDGRKVLAWVDPQISHVIREKYFNLEIEYRFDCALADYFGAKWADVTKPLNLPRRKGAYSQSQRKVPDQPLIYSPGVYNLRKLRQWPYHLIRSYRFGAFVEETCFNFEWLWSKCQATCVRELIEDMEFALEQLKTKTLPTYVKNDLEESDESEDQPRIPIITPISVIQPVLESGSQSQSQAADDEDDPPFDDERKNIEMLHRILQMTHATVKHDTFRLAVQLLAQLSPLTKDVALGVQQLRRQVVTWCQTSSVPCLVPQSQCMPYPGSELRNHVVINIANKGEPYMSEKKVCLSNNTKVLYAIDHQKTGDYLVQYDVTKDLKIISLNLLQDRDIRRINIAGKDANAGKEMYFRFDFYKRRGKISSEVDQELKTIDMVPITTLPEDCELLALSPSGNHAAVKIPLTPGRAAMGQVPLLTLVNVLTGRTLNVYLGKPIEFQYCVFSPDEKYLVVFAKNGVYSFTVENAKVRHRWEEVRKNGVYTQNHVNRLRHCAVITKTSQLIMPGVEARNTVTLYRRDLKTGETMYEMKGTKYPVDMMVMNEENTIGAAGTCFKGVLDFKDEEYDPLDLIPRDKQAIIWDLEWGKQLSKVGRGPGTKEGTCFSAMAFCGMSDDYLLTNCTDGQSSITMWYIGPRTEPCGTAIPVHELNIHSAPIIHLFVADKGQRLVSASIDNSIAVWELAKVYDKCDKVLGSAKNSPEDLEELHGVLSKDVDAPYNPGEGMIVTTSVAVSRNGQIGVVGTHDGWVIFYDLDTMKMTKYEKVGQGQKVNFMMCTKSGRFFISACEDLRVWIPDTGLCRHVLKVACRSRVDSLAESRDILVAGYSGRECCAMVWNLHTGLRLRRLDGFYGFGKVAITSDASKVVGTFFDFPMIFNIHTGEPENSAHMETNKYDCTCLKVSPDNNFVASASTDGSVKVMDFKTGAYRLWLIHSSPVFEAIFTPNSMRLLTAGFKKIFIWSTLDGTFQGSLDFHKARINELHFTMQGRFLVTCSDDKDIVVWDFAKRTPITNFKTHCPQESVAVTPDLNVLLFSPRHIAYVGVLKPNPTLREQLGPTLAEEPEEGLVRLDQHYDSDSW